MPFELPDNLHPDCAPIAWLLGTWRGNGHGDYPTIDAFQFGQECIFTHDGRPFFHYMSRAWIVDEQGEKVRDAAIETGFLRPKADGTLEWLLTHNTGFAEVYYGTSEGAKIEVSTDAVVRTETAKEYVGGHRMYGLVEGDLLWAYDMAAHGREAPAAPVGTARPPVATGRSPTGCRAAYTGGDDPPRARAPGPRGGLAGDAALEGLPAHPAARARAPRGRAARARHPGRDPGRRARGVAGGQHLHGLPDPGAARGARAGAARAHLRPGADLPLRGRPGARPPRVPRVPRHHRGRRPPSSSRWSRPCGRRTAS